MKIEKILNLVKYLRNKDFSILDNKSKILYINKVRSNYKVQ